MKVIFSNKRLTSSNIQSYIAEMYPNLSIKKEESNDIEERQMDVAEDNDIYSENGQQNEEVTNNVHQEEENKQLQEEEQKQEQQEQPVLQEQQKEQYIQQELQEQEKQEQPIEKQEQLVQPVQQEPKEQTPQLPQDKAKLPQRQNPFGQKDELMKLFVRKGFVKENEVKNNNPQQQQTVTTQPTINNNNNQQQPLNSQTQTQAQPQIKPQPQLQPQTKPQPLIPTKNQVHNQLNIMHLKKDNKSIPKEFCRKIRNQISLLFKNVNPQNEVLLTKLLLNN